MIDYASYQTIATERRGRILTLTLNRPDVMNMVDPLMHEELARIFYDVQLDEEADIVVLTGAGRAFSAGGDVRQMVEAYDAGKERLSRADAKRIIFSLLDLEKPIIARVNGHAMGLGATLALFCDVIFMAEKAKIGDAHVPAGVAAGDGGAIIWPQLIGYARAKEWLMTGDAMTAQEAERLGLVNHVVPLEELDARVYGLAERLASGPVKAIQYTKVAVNIGLKQLAHSIMDVGIAYEWINFKSKDHREAAAAFLERRQPRFTGQ